MLVASSALISVDWLQTLQIAKNPNKFYEKNLILGKHPSAKKVNIYFGSVLIGNIAIAKLLPKKYRKKWLTGVIALEVICIGSNHTIGVRIND